MLKKISVGLIGLSIVLMLAVIIVPYCIDVERYKPEILAKAREQLGREVTIEGNLQVRVLPSPGVTIENIKLANLEGASQPSMASIEAVKIQVALWPLLRKKIQFTKIELIRPDILLEVMPDGQANWVFMPQTSESKVQNSSARTTSSDQPLDIEIHSLEVSKGHIIYKQDHTVHEIKDLSTNISLSSLEGPFEGKGDFTYNNQKMDFELNLGRYQAIQPFTAKFKTEALKASLTGQLSALEKTYQGDLTLDIQRQDLEKFYGIKVPETFGSDLKLQAKTFASAKQIKLEDIKVQAGQLTASGEVLADLQDNVHVQGKFKDMPGGLEIKIGLAQNGENYKGGLEGQVQRLKDLMQALHLDIQDIPPTLLGKLGIKSDLKIAPSEMHFSSMVAELAQTQITGNVIWFTKNSKPSLVMDLKTANSSPLWALAGFSLPRSIESAEVKGKVEGDIQNLSYDFQGRIGKTLLSLKGQAQDLAQKPKYDVTVDLKSSTFVEFVKKFDINLPELLTQIDFSGTFKGTTEKLNLNLNSLVGELTVQAQGMIDHLSKGPTFDIHLAANHPQLKKLLGIVGNSTHTPLGHFSGEGQFVGNAQNFKLDHLKGNLGTAGTFTGLINYSHPKEKPLINADLQFSAIQLDSLLAFLGDSVTVPPQGLQIMHVALKPKTSPSTSSAAPRWSHDKLDLKFLNYFDAAFKISSPEVKKEELLFNDVTFVAEIQKGILRIDHLKAKLYGGEVMLTGTTDSKDNQCDYTFSALGAELKNFSSKDSAVKIVQGKMDLQGHLLSKGASVYDLVSHLKGDVSLKAQDGVVSGFDLHRVIANLKNMKQLQGFLQGISQLLSMSFNKGQTSFSQLQAEAKILEGKANLHNVKLLVDGGEGSAQGFIDLPRYILDIQTQFLITDIKGLPPIQVHFTGPLDQPQRSIDSKALQQYLLKNVVSAGGVIDAIKSGATKPADILGAIIGGKKQTQDTAQPSENTPAANQESQPPSDKPTAADVVKNPQEAVKGLLKGLF